jgi:hypothetical protein
MLLGEKILKLSPEKEAKNDFILFETSRYDKHFDYDPHYECKMDKMNITTVGTYLYLRIILISLILTLSNL